MESPTQNLTHKSKKNHAISQSKKSPIHRFFKEIITAMTSKCIASIYRGLLFILRARYFTLLNRLQHYLRANDHFCVTEELKDMQAVLVLSRPLN